MFLKAFGGSNVLLYFGSWFEEEKKFKRQTGCMMTNPFISQNYIIALVWEISWTQYLGNRWRNRILTDVVSQPSTDELQTRTNSNRDYNRSGLTWCSDWVAAMTCCQRKHHRQTKQPCKVFNHFNTITDKPKMSADYCDNVVRTHTQTQTHTAESNTTTFISKLIPMRCTRRRSRGVWAAHSHWQTKQLFV